MKDFIIYCVKVFLMFAIMMVAFCLTGCRTVQTVVEYRDRKTTDTITLYDSIYIDRIQREQIRADTVWKTDSIIEYRYRVINRDVEVFVHDSIPYEVQVIKEITKNSKFAKFCIFFFLIVAFGLFFFFIFKLRKTFTP